MTSKFETRCPLENDGDKIELEFPFSAPNLPSAVSMTKFRWLFLSLPVLSICVASKQCLSKFKQIPTIHPGKRRWKFLDGDRSFMEDLHCHDCRDVKRIFQDHWIGRDCLELPINSGTKLQQPGDLKTKKTANLQSFAHILDLLCSLVIARRKKHQIEKL